MALTYRNLDGRTREFMAKELKQDVASRNLYISPRLNAEGKAAWESLVLEAISSQNDAWLSEEIRRRRLLNSEEERRKPTGGTIMAKVPENASDTLAEGEFNRYYARGLCARAIQDKVSQVEVYRGRHSQKPRPESEALIGTRLDPAALLNDLRSSIGVEPALDVPPGPNSGLSVFLP